PRRPYSTDRLRRHPGERHPSCSALRSRTCTAHWTRGAPGEESPDLSSEPAGARADRAYLDRPESRDRRQLPRSPPRDAHHAIETLQQGAPLREAEALRRGCPAGRGRQPASDPPPTDAARVPPPADRYVHP